MVYVDYCQHPNICDAAMNQLNSRPLCGWCFKHRWMGAELGQKAKSRDISADDESLYFRKTVSNFTVEEKDEEVRFGSTGGTYAFIFLDADELDAVIDALKIASARFRKYRKPGAGKAKGE